MRFAILAAALLLAGAVRAQTSDFPNHCHLCGCCPPPLTVDQLRHPAGR